MRSRIASVLARHGKPGALFGALRSGAVFRGGLTWSLKGSVSAGAVLAGVLSQLTLTSAAVNGTTLYVSEGDSITADGNSYSRQFAATDATNIQFIDAAVSGNQISDLIARKATVKGYVTANPGKTNYILTVMVGTNQSNGSSYYPSDPTGFVTTYMSYLAEMRSAGYYVIALSILPTTKGATFESWVGPVNAGIAAGEGIYYDKFINVDPDIHVGTVARTNTAVYPDGLHPSFLGHYYLERIVAPFINDAISGGVKRLVGSITGGLTLAGTLTGTGGGVSTIAFDPARKSSNLTLSNSNFTVDGQGGFHSACIADSVSGTQKKYIEFVNDSSTTAEFGWGVFPAGANLDKYAGQEGNDGFANWMYNDSYLTGPSFTAGYGVAGSAASFGKPFANNVYMLAIDCAAGKLWVGVNGAWNNLGDPATGVRPAATFTPGLTLYPSVTSNVGGFTISVPAHASYDAPAGFTAIIGSTVAPTFAGTTFWSLTDHHHSYEISPSHKTLFANVAAKLKSARAAQSFSSGKKFIEFKLKETTSTGSAQVGFGFADAGFDVANYYLGEAPTSFMYWLNNAANPFVSGSGLVNAGNAANPNVYVGADRPDDVYAYAIDFDAGKVWISKAGVWLCGDPAAGTAPFLTFTPGGTWFPAATIGQSGTTSLEIPYPNVNAAPSGFTVIN